MSLTGHPHIPLIQVSHLPSASSFYASLTQPLNIRYLSATTTFPATLHFGRLTSSGAQPLFSLTQSPVPNPPLGTIYLPAATPKQINDFWAKSRVLNPGCRETGIIELDEEEGRKAITRDLDGNILEAIYSPRGPMGGNSRVGAPAPPTLETASTEKEARRVLQWQKEVAKSVSGAGDDDNRSQASGATENVARSQVGRADSFPVPMRLVRRETVTEHYTQEEPDNRRDSGVAGTGISGKAIIGTLLGAAAGAAVAYAMVKTEEPVRVRPTPSQGGRSASYSHPIEVRPSRSHVSAREVDEGMQKERYVRYAIQPAPTPPPTGLVRAYTDGASGVGVRVLDQGEVGSRVSVRSKARSRSEYPPDAGARSRVDDSPRSRVDEGEGSHVSTRSRRSRARSHVSGHSKAESNRDVVEVMEDDRRSVHSHHSHHSMHSMHSAHSKHSRRNADGQSEGSYASARSHASSSTIKPKPSRRSSHAGETRGGTIITIVGRDGERTIDTRDLRESDRGSRVSAREIPLPRSVVSLARDVPLPASNVGSRYGGSRASQRQRDPSVDSEEEGGYGGGLGGSRYAASVAPSDSVSSVGIKRERERLRDRMSIRNGGW